MNSEEEIRSASRAELLEYLQGEGYVSKAPGEESRDHLVLAAIVLFRLKRDLAKGAAGGLAPQ